MFRPFCAFVRVLFNTGLLALVLIVIFVVLHESLVFSDLKCVDFHRGVVFAPARAPVALGAMK